MNLMQMIQCGDFNPRSYKRSDKTSVFNTDVVLISIHAPTRGATSTVERSPGADDDFNPRSYKRSDATIAKIGEAGRISIHAPTRGATFIKFICIC